MNSLEFALSGFSELFFIALTFCILYFVYSRYINVKYFGIKFSNPNVTKPSFKWIESKTGLLICYNSEKVANCHLKQLVEIDPYLNYKVVEFGGKE